MKQRALRPAVAGWLALLVVLTAFSLRGFGQFELGTYSDDGVYVTLARSLVFSGSYEARTGPGPAQQVPYPFVFPMVLAPLVAMWPDANDYLTLPSLAATLINASLLFWGWALLSRGASPRWALVIAALYALNPLTIGHTNMVMSEAVFTALTLSALITTEAAVRRPAVWRFVLLGFLASCVFYARSAGAVLIPAVAWRVLWGERTTLRSRAGALVAGVLLLIVPVLLLTSVRPHDLVPIAYLRNTAANLGKVRRDGDVASVIARAGGRLSAYATTLVRTAIFPIGGGEREAELAAHLGVPWLPASAGLLITALIVLGATCAAPRLAPSVRVFEILYLAMIVAWPFLSSRFLYPVVPFLSFQFLTGVHWAAAAALRNRRAGARVAFALAACCVAVLAIGSVWKDLSPVVPSTQFTRDFRNEGNWLRRNTAPDAVVMTEYPIALHLHSARSTVAVPEVASAGDLLGRLDDEAVSFIEIGPALEWHVDGRQQYSPYTAQTFVSLLEQLQDAGRLSVIYASDPHDLIRIYRVDPPGTSSRPDPSGHAAQHPSGGG